MKPQPGARSEVPAFGLRPDGANIYPTLRKTWTKPGKTPERTVALVIASFLYCLVYLLMAAPVSAQLGWGPNARPKFPRSDHHPNGSFTFGRLFFEQNGYEPLGHGWNTDYPDSDMNLMMRVEELTMLSIAKDSRGQPDHMVLQATNKQIFDFPFLFASDVGTIWFDSDDATALRRYLLTGGFLWVDDFWGERAWRRWEEQIDKVLPRGEYPIVDLTPEHPLFHSFFTVRQIPQVPSIQHWYRSGGQTSERGAESATPHMRAIFDSKGHMLVLMSHNTDIADGWEREGESDLFFELFSVTKSYPVGINVVLYTLTH
jgi:hypothetical protein